MNFWILAGVFNPRNVRRSRADNPKRSCAIFDTPLRFKPKAATPVEIGAIIPSEFSDFDVGRIGRHESGL